MIPSDWQTQVDAMPIWVVVPWAIGALIIVTTPLLLIAGSITQWWIGRVTRKWRTRP